MKPAKAKKTAAAAGLELYYSTEWRSWGLTDPACNVESIWLSPGELREATEPQFGLYIATMQERINPDAGGPFPIA